METAHLLLSLELKGISLKCQQLYLSNFFSANTPEAWRPSGLPLTSVWPLVGRGGTERGLCRTDGRITQV